MFDFILDVTVLSALLFFAVSLESYPSSTNFSHRHPSCVSIMSRYLIIAVLAFPGIAFAGFRAAERVRQRVGMKILSYAGAFSGRPYISEILLSAAISIAFLGLVAARKLTRRLIRRVVTLAASSAGIVSSH